MPRRDGAPTAEEIAAQQRAAVQQPPDTGPSLAQVTAAAVAATIATSAAADAAGAPVDAAAQTASLLANATETILTGFDAFLAARRVKQQVDVTNLITEEAPGLTADQRGQIVAQELERERVFAAKMRERLREDLKVALAIEDPGERADAVRTILDRERRLLKARDDAMTGRIRGFIHAANVERVSPDGAYWKQGPKPCPQCEPFVGKVWPWSVLAVKKPPLHPHCDCSLWSTADAERMGWVTPKDYATADDQLLEAVFDQIAETLGVDPEDLNEALALVEARYDTRFPKGTTKAGEWRPRRGGAAGLRIHHRAPRHHLHLPGLEVAPVKHVGPEVQDLNVAELKPGDHVMVNGELQRVEEVHKPGLLVLDGMGLVHIDRDKIAGVPGEPSDPTPEPGAPAPIHPGAPSFADIEQHLLTRKMGKLPAEAGALEVPGFAYLGKGEKVSYKRELRDGTLHLPDGFFRQGRDRREEIVFKHLGGQLADRLGENGLKALSEQDPHLDSRARLADTYFAINTPARDRMVELHPDASRLVAQAAHEQGLPLHPDAAKLIGQPLTVDATPQEHPAHALARRVEGLSGMESRDMLGEAGYTYGGSTTTTDGHVHYFHNHDAGATISTLADETGKVESASVSLPEPVGATERAALVGKTSREAIDHMEAEGFASNYTASGDWLRFVHPDGRGRALREIDGTVTHVAAFTPTEREARDAGHVVLSSDPLAHIKPGQDFAPIRAALDTGARWHQTDSGNTPDLSLTDGATRFVEYRSHTDVNDRLVMHLRDEPGGGLTVVAAGHGSIDPAKRGQIVTDAERTADATAVAEAERRADEARKHAAGDLRERLHAASTSGSESDLKKALVGLAPDDAVRVMQRNGFELRSRRRSGRGADRRITYTLRGLHGETIKVAGPYTFGASVLDKVEIAGNPQGGSRQRLPEGQAPRSLDELLVDTLGRADELGQRYGAGVHVTGIVQGGVSSGAIAHHEWNGTIAIRKGQEATQVKEYLAKREAGEPLNDRDHLAFFHAIQVLQHEVNHGLAKPGDEDGGLSFGRKHYQGVGKNIEEFLTEETAHPLAIEWLRSHGMTEVLRAVKRAPQDPRVLGTYRTYRVQLRRILDDAGVPEEDRRALLERMKFQMTPRERIDELLRLSGHDNIVSALHDQPRRRSEMERDFQPILRHDLDDIDATQHVALSTGRTITDGDEVTVTDGEGNAIQGTVVGLLDYMARVQTPDGMTLWYDINRVH